MKHGMIPLVLFVLCAAGCTSRLYDVKMSNSLFVKSHKGQTVHVDVRNTSSVQHIPVAEMVRERVRNKGYLLVDDPAKADVVLRANIRYTGLMEKALKADKVLAGAVIGGVVGGAGTYAASKSQSGTIAGVLGGMLLGAGLGTWLDAEDRKDTFVTIVDLRVLEAGAAEPKRANIYARLREKGLTMESAAERVFPDIAKQIAGVL
ncbi:MAG: complement resistance protein TraT [Planctomycetota bacterium]